jgi:hypothetical protein
VISCWLDGYAAVHEKQLREWFPQVMIQPKGLLATEGFISFPFVGEEGARLSLGSHFFEFRNPETNRFFSPTSWSRDASMKSFSPPPAACTATNERPGGSHRTQRCFSPPEIRGKADRVSDLFGEKLHEQLIEDTLKRLDSEMNLKPLFAMAAPEGDHYVLYLQLNPEQESIHQTEDPGRFYTRLAEAFDEGLRTNFHYHHCRKLGQLKPLRVFRLTGNSHQEYLEECVKRGQRLGDVKPTALHLQGGWDLVFKGEYQ